MVRVTNAVSSRRRRKRLRKLAKGFFGDRRDHLRLTKDAVMKALHYNTHHRKLKKRDFRTLWIERINVAARINGLSYSKFIYGLKNLENGLNRKMLAEMALNDPKGFAVIAEDAKKALK
ncbi:MAG: 50S ribosomal protein L20 [Chlamydiae bacterium]|nr:50S ribosomal protein L20 [Chlamydiota bacterium]